MKKILTVIALLAAAINMQAQTKFHDVEANEATGPVKKISTEVMGRPQVTSFTQDGKMQRDGLSDVVYNDEGYLQSFTITSDFGSISMKMTWENGRLKSQSTDMMGQEMVITFVYDEKGLLKSQNMNMGGQEFSIPYTDYQFDSKGNWISRKTSMMGQETTQTRTIEYYE
ncbi:MAG: hypothetical protein ACSW8D_04410 [Prevotella sp.]